MFILFNMGVPKGGQDEALAPLKNVISTAIGKIPNEK